MLFHNILLSRVLEVTLLYEKISSMQHKPRPFSCNTKQLLDAILTCVVVGDSSKRIALILLLVLVLVLVLVLLMLRL